MYESSSDEEDAKPAVAEKSDASGGQAKPAAVDDEEDEEEEQPPVVCCECRRYFNFSELTSAEKKVRAAPCASHTFQGRVGSIPLTHWSGDGGRAD